MWLSEERVSEMKSKSIIVVFSIFVCLYQARFANAQKPEIKIGVASNFSEIASNSYNPLGNHFKNGIDLAVLNSNSSLQNINLKLIQLDYENTPLKILDLAQKAHNDNLLLVVGYEFSQHALLAAPLHYKLKFPMFTPSASANRLKDYQDYVYQGTFNNNYQTKALAYFANNKLKFKKATIILVSDCAYCQDISQSFEENFKGMGGKIVNKISILSSDKDLGLFNRICG